MRINRFVARASGLSRRAADAAIADGRVHVNGQPARTGQDVGPDDTVTLDDGVITPSVKSQAIMLNKPAGYVCSRVGQGSKTVYELLPPELHHLKPVGRLDKDSSGLLLLTDDGGLAERLTHPRYGKKKVYEAGLNKPLAPEDADRIGKGVELEDGLSRLAIADLRGKNLTIVMSEGRNRQIRRTFAALRYEVTKLHRIRFGDYTLGSLQEGRYNRSDVKESTHSRDSRTG